ncbi:MAG: leucine-rich repeat domain-containing protein [Clostridia bacterium]|nr:leucine-rich repeat domain-containing protein [Clostridia bacterium]
MKAIRRIVLLLCVAISAFMLFGCKKSEEGLNFEKTPDGKGYIVTKYIGEDKEVIVPAKHEGLPVVAIGECAFEGCSKMENIVLPESIQLIEEYAFYRCNKLLDVRIPSGVKVIENNAFKSCEYLRYIYLPDTLESLGATAFAYCSRITEINIDDANTVYHDKDNCLIESESKTLVLGCQYSVIPEDGSVTSIGASAFCGAKFLETLKLSSNITKVGANAFEGCYALRTIYLAKSVKEIGESAFLNCFGLDAVYYEGTLMQWNEISVSDLNYHFKGASIYCESDI